MPSPSFLTFDQVAELLHVPLATVRYWAAIGKLNAYKPGRHPLVKQSDVEAFVEGASVIKLRASRAKQTRAARAVAR
jgi:excisionase family DNA binding protein